MMLRDDNKRLRPRRMARWLALLLAGVTAASALPAYADGDAQAEAEQATWTSPEPGQPPLSLADVLSSAQAHFPSIRAAAADRMVAEGELLAAEGSFDPVWRTSAVFDPVSGYPSYQLDTVIEQPTALWGMSLVAGYRLGLGDFPDYDGKLQTNDAGEVRAGAKLPLWRNGAIDRRRANVQKAELGTDIAQLSFEQQVLEVRRASAVRYWDWVAAGERVRVVRSWLQNALERDMVLRRRVAVGEIPELEQLENARALMQRKSQLVQAERALEQAAIELSLFLRTSQGPVLPAADRLPFAVPEPLLPTSFASAESEGLGRRPELRRIDAQRAQTSVELTWAENQQWPALDLFASTSVDLGDGDEKRGKPVVELGVTLEIPIPGRAQRGLVQVQNANLQKLNQQAQLQEDRIRNEVRDAQSALKRALERVRAIEEELELAKKLERSEERRYELGDSTLLFVNLREQITLETQLRAVDARADFQRALVAHRYAIGSL